MNTTKTRLTITAQIIIEHHGEYEPERDLLIEQLESEGWTVTIEDEDDVE